MHVEALNLPGVLLLIPDIFRDERGEFFEAYQRDRYREIGVTFDFFQDNVSVSKRGVLRGLHYQIPPAEQGKLVQVMMGSVLDVALDIRFDSPTFGQHVAIELSAANRKQLWIPPGFAHGFVALEEGTIFSYKCTRPYSKAHERGVRYNDPALAIEWGVSNPTVALRDATFPLLRDIDRDFLFEADLPTN